MNIPIIVASQAGIAARIAARNSDRYEKERKEKEEEESRKRRNRRHKGRSRK